MLSLNIASERRLQQSVNSEKMQDITHVFWNKDERSSYDVEFITSDNLQTYPVQTWCKKFDFSLEQSKSIET